MSTEHKAPLPWRRHLLLFGLALLGVLLLTAGNFLPAAIGGERGEAKEEQDTLSSEAEVTREYARMLSAEIEALCAAAIGNNEVRAVVSLKGGFQYIYATDREEKQSESGSQVSSHYVTTGSGSSESAVLLTGEPPQISGIGVVCCMSGGGITKNELVSLLSAAYGVGTNKIYIVDSSGK